MVSDVDAFPIGKGHYQFVRGGGDVGKLIGVFDLRKRSGSGLSTGFFTGRKNGAARQRQEVV